jgi:hypothetical protein
MCGTSETQQGAAEQVAALERRLDLLEQRESERRVFLARVLTELSAANRRLEGAESAEQAHVREEAARLEADAIALSQVAGGHRRAGRPDLRVARRSA